MYNKITKMKELEKTLKALSNRRRLAIIKCLKGNKEMSVSALATEIKLAFKSTSRHLTVLRGANIVEGDQRNLSVFYSLAKEQVPVARYIISQL